MKMISAHSRYPQTVTGISTAVLLGALALTSAVDGLGMSDEATAAPVAEVRLTRSQRGMCEECGVVASSRRIAQSVGEATATAVTLHEATVRMRDGSHRTFIEDSSVHWRSGERIILIGDAGQSVN